MCGTEQAREIQQSPSSKTAISPSSVDNGTLRRNESSHADSVDNGTPKRNLSPDAVINLDHGDPTIYEPYWEKVGEKCTVMIKGYESLSYFSTLKNLCWFLEPKLEEEIKRLHRMVGNAVVEDYHVIVGTGSSQLVQAVLYAIAPRDDPEPISVVCAAPYYSAYPEMVDFLKSRLYQWDGDAHTFDKDGPYIEFITSPNNPDGSLREAVVNRGDEGKLVHDLAYYWPQYTPITSPLNHDIMLFTVSKCTGHAGSRIGWALVKDKEVAKRMTKFMEVSTIGVSKDSQLRAAKILQVISDGCESSKSENFFKYGQKIMADRWERLKNVLQKSQMFIPSKYPVQYCNFLGDFTETHPAFAWIKCKDSVEDCENLFRGHKVLARSGRRFGSDPKYVRVSMVSKEEEFNLFLKRLSAIQSAEDGNGI